MASRNLIVSFFCEHFGMVKFRLRQVRKINGEQLDFELLSQKTGGFKVDYLVEKNSQISFVNPNKQKTV